ncbi:MAG: pyridoxal phosphate-dependent aminotransferase [Thermodesulfobacteriota bacterium]
MSIAKKIEAMQSGQSWIRKMFEEGARLKAKYGAKNVFDFSIGNPNLAPPEQFTTVLLNIIRSSKTGDHGYMPNTGYPFVRQRIAEYLSKEQETPMTQDDIIMTCGAAGALNVVFKAILDPGDEVICSAPYFVEYNTYVDNHGGVLRTVSSKEDFTLDMNAISEAITNKTKAVLINSPNNPTGQIYSAESLKQLGNLLAEKGKKLNRTIYLISDEPYRKIVYDGIEVPSLFPCYAESIIVTSYSKDLSIPGERIGFLAVNPNSKFRNALLGGMALTNRILGFVNAPALMQRCVAELQGIHTDISAYARKRELLCKGLAESGYIFEKPKGAFYLFPRSPIPDDVQFVQALQEELILTVPGSGFKGQGYFRIAFCVDDETIINSMSGFKKAINKFK